MIIIILLLLLQVLEPVGKNVIRRNEILSGPFRSQEPHVLLSIFFV